MDTCTSMETSKRQKVFEGESNDDRITHLPDNVLHYILSFLPTKYAVGTCVLSTRWKYLWTSVHNFDFCDEQLYTGSKSKNYSRRKTLFRDFVDRVLLLSDVANINKFSLSCKACDTTDFKKWINIITRRKVEELAISIRHNTPYMFPKGIIPSESLRILQIEMDEHIKIPAAVNFFGLKILDLKNITFYSDQEVQEVSLSFPILEKLVMVSCRWLNFKTVNIDVPTLRVLTIDGPCMYAESHDCGIKIDAKRLISLKFRSEFLYKYSLCNLSSLVDASIDISRRCEIIHVRSFLREIYNVKDLELSNSSIEVLANPDIAADVRSLHHLTRLRGLWGSCVSGRALINLLCNMPKIESLIFGGGLTPFIFSGHGRILGTTPQCFLSHLKLVDICHFSGKQRETWFVKFLIKSVTVMDNLTIKLGRCSNKSAEWKERITRQLETSRKYQNCVLEFY